MVGEILTNIVVFVLLGLIVWRCLQAWGARVPQMPLLADRGLDEPFIPSKKSLGVLFGAMLSLRAVMLLAQATWVANTADGGLTAQSFEFSFMKWDGLHYTHLVDEGYRGYVENGDTLFVVFFPLYVWITRLVGFIIPNTIAAGVVVSSVCFAWGCCYVYRLAALLTNERTAKYAVLVLACYPYSFFSGLMYTEGLFLLTSAAALYYLLQRKWGGFALWGALASLTRMTGVLLIAPAVVVMLKDTQFLKPPVGESMKKGLKTFFKELAGVLAPLLGTAGYLLLNVYVAGDPFAFMGYQEHWYNGWNWIGNVIPYIWEYAIDNISGPNGWAIFLPEFCLFWLMIALLGFSAFRKKVPASLLTYGYVYFVVSFSQAWLISGGRYLSSGVVYFLFVAMLTEDRPWLQGLILIGQSVFMGLNFGLHLMNAQVM